MAKIDSFLVEQNIISILLKQPELIHKVTSQIKPEYFSDSPNRKQNKAIFMTMDYISRKSNMEDLKFDSMTILSVVDKNPSLAKSLKNIFPKQEEFVQYIETLKESPIDPSNLDIHLEELKKINITNELYNKLERFNEDMLDNYKEWDKNEIINKAETQILEVSNKYNADESKTFIEANKDRLEKYKHKKPNKNSFTGLPTHFDRLNNFTGGILRKGSVSIINAKSGIGKSLLLENIAVFLAIEHNIPVYLGTNEMMVEENEHRIIKNLTGLPMIIIENNLFNSPKKYIEVNGKKYKTSVCKNKVMEAVKKIDDSPIYFDQIRAYTPNILANRAKYFKKRHNIKLFIFDYIKETSAPEVQEKALRHFLGSVVEVMKEEIADRLEIPVLSACQANGNNVMISNESKDIERYSTFFGVLRRLKNNERRPMDGEFGLSVKKNRYGRVHSNPRKNYISLDLNKDKLKFEEVNY